MRKKFQRSVSRAAMWSPRFGGWALLLLLLVLILHRFEFIWPNDFIMGFMASGVLALIGLGLAIKGFGDLWTRGDKAGRASIKGMIYSLLTLTPFMFMGIIWFVIPPFYDISSDLDNPPLYPAWSRPYDALPPLDNFMKQADLQQKSWPDLSGRRYEVSSDSILTAIDAVMEENGWEKSHSMRDDDNVEFLVLAVARMPVLGLAFDMVIRVRDEDEATQVDMRVTARDFTHDLGFGAHSISTFMQVLDREVLLGGIEQIDEN